MPKLCVGPGCTTRPNFDLAGGKGTHCVTHKTAEMVDVKHVRCAAPGCPKVNPNFNHVGGKGTHCAVHKTAEMVDVVSKRCAEPGCLKQPGFDLAGGKGTHCAVHKTEDMVDVKHVRCAAPGCKIRPSFDLAGGKGTHCAVHKSAEMVDVKNVRCAEPGCLKLNPGFDLAGGKGTHCAVHKTDGMVDVVNNRCMAPGCPKLNPTFDLAGGKGTHCAVHKSAEMVDVRNKRCVCCKTSASYGRPGLQVSHCAKHRLPGMIRRPNAKCESCTELAIWGTNWVPLHCENHKTEAEHNLVERECASCKLVMVLDMNGRCEYCDPKRVRTVRLAKQNALMAYLDRRGLAGCSTDTTIDGGECGLERPDRVYDMGDKIVVLECDEDQHKGRACVCEQTRMVNIGQSFGGLPVYFIRWNPDRYGAAGATPNARRTLAAGDALAVRYKLVGDLIQDIRAGVHAVPAALVAAKYLYFDGWSALAAEGWAVVAPLEAPRLLMQAPLAWPTMSQEKKKT